MPGRVPEEQGQKLDASSRAHPGGRPGQAIIKAIIDDE